MYTTIHILAEFKSLGSIDISKILDRKIIFKAPPKSKYLKPQNILFINTYKKDIQ